MNYFSTSLAIKGEWLTKHAINYFPSRSSLYAPLVLFLKPGRETLLRTSPVVASRRRNLSKFPFNLNCFLKKKIRCS
ncbi:Uncharacterized protein TCM_041379 [Theobroma cacao]|uniref:Uncharacterized protein n=1 Tax=Theobroma cacao TaxID=3641 RepID=A0A061GW36_THECC|nr:Uncharacterized protein TCM_041379 [Theobroma cacao]